MLKFTINSIFAAGILLGLTPLSNAAEKPPELKIEITSYVGQTQTHIARHSEYLFDQNGLSKTRAGIVHRGGYTPERWSPHAYSFGNAAYVFEAPTNCRDLLQSQQHLALHQMLSRGVIDSAQYEQLSHVVDELDLDQVSFVEVKRSFNKRVKTDWDHTPKVGEFEERDAQDLAFEEYSQYYRAYMDESTKPEPKTRKAKFWKKVGATWIVSGQAGGKNLPLPHQLKDAVGFPEIDRSKYKAVWEIGRTAVTDGQNLKDILPIVAQRIRNESAAMGIPLDDAWIMVRASDRLHEMLYTRYGLDVLWKAADGENTRMAISLVDLLKRFPPESLGLRNEKRFVDMKNFLPFYERQIPMDYKNYTLGLRYFAPAMRDGVDIPESIQHALELKTHDYRAGEVTALDRTKYYAFNEAKYPKRYLIESRMNNREFFFDRNLFYKDNQVIQLDLPLEIETFEDLGPFLHLAMEQLHYDLRARGIADSAAWIRKKKIHFAFETQSEKLALMSKTPGMRRVGGFKAHTLLNPYITQKQGNFFTRELKKYHPGLSIILIDASHFLEAAGNGPFVNLANDERLLRSFSDLD